MTKPETPYEYTTYIVEWEPGLIGPPGTAKGAGCVRVEAKFPYYNRVDDWMARDLIDALKEARPDTKVWVETRGKREL